MSADHRDAQVPEWPHKPAPPDPRRLFPPWPLLSRGLALAVVGLVAAIVGVEAARRGLVTGLLLAPVMAVVAVLFAWAAAVHLTGGERFDDHPWV